MLYQNFGSLLKTLLPVQTSQMVAIFFFITTYYWAEGQGMCPWSSLALSVHGSSLNPLAHLLLITLLSDYITYYTFLLQPMLQSPPPVQSPLFIPGFSSLVHSFSQLLVSSFLEISISMWSLHTYIYCLHCKQSMQYSGLSVAWIPVQRSYPLTKLSHPF